MLTPPLILSLNPARNLMVNYTLHSFSSPRVNAGKGTLVMDLASLCISMGSPGGTAKFQLAIKMGSRPTKSVLIKNSVKLKRCKRAFSKNSV